MDYTHTGLEIVGRHVPDDNAGPFDNAQQAQAMGYDTLNPVTGTYEIGVVIEGAFVPLISEKASLVYDRIDNAARQTPPPAAAPADETPPPAAVPAESQEPPAWWRDWLEQQQQQQPADETPPPPPPPADEQQPPPPQHEG